MPLFSETLSSARRTGTIAEFLAGEARTASRVSSNQAVRKQLLAQGGAVDAERFGRAALVAAAPAQHFAQQGRFHFAHQQRVQPFGTARALQVGEIAARAARYAFAQGRSACIGGGGQGRGGIERRGFHVCSKDVQGFDKGCIAHPGPQSVAPLSSHNKWLREYIRLRASIPCARRYSNPNSNATAFLPGSSTSNTAATVPSGGNPAARVFGSPT